MPETPEKKIAIVVISSDGSLDLLTRDLPDLLTRREEILETMVVEAMAMLKAVETDPLTIAVIEDIGPTMRPDHYRCIGCGKKISNRRAKTDIARCGQCRRGGKK